MRAKSPEFRGWSTMGKIDFYRSGYMVGDNYAMVFTGKNVM